MLTSLCVCVCVGADSGGVHVDGEPEATGQRVITHRHAPSVRTAPRETLADFNLPLLSSFISPFFARRRQTHLLHLPPPALSLGFRDLPSATRPLSLICGSTGKNKQPSAPSRLGSRSQHQPAGSRDTSHELWIDGSAGAQGSGGRRRSLRPR